MFPNRYRYPAMGKYQRGFLIPLSIFILVVMGILALVVARTSEQSNRSFTQELLSVQTFYAAETGAQRAMQVLFFPDATNRAAVDARCVSLNQTYNFSGIDGLNLCSAQVNCQCTYADASNCIPSDSANYSETTTRQPSFYTVTSLGRCGADTFLAERRIQAGAYLEQE